MSTIAYFYSQWSLLLWSISSTILLFLLGKVLSSFSFSFFFRRSPSLCLSFSFHSLSFLFLSSVIASPVAIQQQSDEYASCSTTINSSSKQTQLLFSFFFSILDFSYFVYVIRMMLTRCLHISIHITFNERSWGLM